MAGSLTMSMRHDTFAHILDEMDALRKTVLDLCDTNTSRLKHPVVRRLVVERGCATRVSGTPDLGYEEECAFDYDWDCCNCPVIEGNEHDL